MIRIDQLAWNRIGMYLLIGSRAATDYLVLFTLEEGASLVLQAAFLSSDSVRLGLALHRHITRITYSSVFAQLYVSDIKTVGRYGVGNCAHGDEEDSNVGGLHGVARAYMQCLKDN